MAQKAIVLSEEDAAILQQVIDRVKRDTPAARQLAGEESDYLTPEMYLAKAPASGVPAAAGDVLGSAECEVYRVDRASGKVEPRGLTRTVYNAGPSIAAGMFAHMERDKFGVWFVTSVAAAVDLTSLTVRSYTSAGGATETDVHAVHPVNDIHLERTAGFILRDSAEVPALGPGAVQVSLAPATVSQSGVVTNQPQTWTGNKDLVSSYWTSDLGVEVRQPGTDGTAGWSLGMYSRPGLAVPVDGYTGPVAYLSVDWSTASVGTRVIVDPAGGHRIILMGYDATGGAQPARYSLVSQFGGVVDGATDAVPYKKPDDTTGTLYFEGGVFIGLTTAGATTTTATTTTTAATATTAGGTTTASATTTQAATTTTQPLAVTCSATPASGTTPLTVTLSCTPSGGSGAYTFAWTKTTGGVTTSVASTQNAQYTEYNSGTDTFTVTITDSTNAQTTCSATVTASGPPAITSISPTSGSGMSSQTVTITGTNFVGVTSVQFGGTNANSYTVDSTTQITAHTPVWGMAGSHPVTVSNASGTSNSVAYSAT
jgi:hypothetical protein